MEREKFYNPEKPKKEFRIHKRWFEEILSGAKTIELRPARDSYRMIAVGDMVIFRCNQDDRTVEAKITGFREYETLEDVSEYEDVSRIAPGMSSENVIFEARKLFRKARESGFMVFEFELKEEDE